MNQRLRFGLFDWIEASRRAPGEVYRHKLELAQAADKADFHAYLIAEHQGTPLSIDGSPSVMLSAIFQRTRQLRAGALTFCLPWYDPYRLYNEICMLDQMSGGRLELGVGRGVSPIESRIFGLQSIDESRQKYREALDWFFQFAGNDVVPYRGEEVEIYNKPVQKPWPPLWFPSSNRESIEFTARHGYHTAFLGRLADCKPHFDRYREFCSDYAAFLRGQQFEEGEVPTQDDLPGAYSVTPFFVPHNTPVGSRSEAMISAYLLGRHHDTPDPEVRGQIVAALQYVLGQQIRPDNDFAVVGPGRGGIPGSPIDRNVRIDFVQHVCSAFIRASEWIDTDD
jgi:hypothetical protein